MEDNSSRLAALDEELDELRWYQWRIRELERVLEAIVIKCRSNEWGPLTPRKEILNWMHDQAAALFSSMPANGIAADIFAAAALQGLLASGGWQDAEKLAERAWRVTEAMMQVRTRVFDKKFTIDH